MKNQISVSIIVPAFNEEKNITPTIEGLEKQLHGVIKEYEILLIDDGSTDNTGKIAEQLAQHYTKIRVFHNKKNKGFGYTFKLGVNNATKQYVVGFPGDNDTSPVSLRDLIMSAKQNSIVMTYPINPNVRSMLRNIISKTFIIIANLLFGMNLRYFNGSFICETKVLRDLDLKSKGLTIYAEAKIRLIKSGYSYTEVPFEHIGRKYGSSKAVNIKSLFETLDIIRILVADIYFH